MTVPEGSLVPAAGEEWDFSFGPPWRETSRYHRASRSLATVTPAGRPLRVAVLSSYTMGFVEPFLRVELRRLGIDSELLVAGFGEVESLWLEETSALHRFSPDLVLVALRVEDMQADAFARAHASAAQTLEHACNALIERVAALLSGTAAKRWTTLVANIARVAGSPFGLADASLEASHASIVSAANERLRRTVTAHAGAFVWDYDGLVRAEGADGWADERLWFIGRIPVASRHHGAMAQHLARTMRAATQAAAKVLVLDLDNTLWGGVVGDDGVAGIKVGDDYPGNQYKLVQRLALGLRDRGILLAIASKNDIAVVQEAFRGHQEFLLRWEDFAASSVNWGPKSRGIAAMADELRLGLDAFVFLDDNPVERAEVRAALPMVKVIDVEAWGSLSRALASCPWFDQLSISNEDLQRAAQYAAERARSSAAAAHQSLEAYLASIALAAHVRPAGDLERARVAQLFAKTNQFNLTLRRPAESVIAQWMDTPDSHRVECMRLSDRFGDHGIIAAAVLRRMQSKAVIDAFVMSCRVMNRRAEYAFVAHLADVAEQWGCTHLVGEYVPGPRNTVVAGLYPDLGFERVADEMPGVERHELPLAGRALVWPALIARTS